jgi:hypothetical protein
MVDLTHKGTEALQQLADEVEQERVTKGHTPFDDVPESDGGQAASPDADKVDSSHDDRDDAVRAAAFGAQSRPQTPGL